MRVIIRLCVQEYTQSPSSKALRPQNIKAKHKSYYNNTARENKTTHFKTLYKSKWTLAYKMSKLSIE